MPGPEARRVKRVRWVRDDTLAFTGKIPLQRWLYGERHYDRLGGTFPVYGAKDLLLESENTATCSLIGYTHRRDPPADLNTGEKLMSAQITEDYSKGI